MRMPRESRSSTSPRCFLSFAVSFAGCSGCSVTAASFAVFARQPRSSCSMPASVTSSHPTPSCPSVTSGLKCDRSTPYSSSGSAKRKRTSMSSSCTAHDSRADASASAPPRLSSAAPVAMIASYVSSMRKSSWLSGLGFLSLKRMSSRFSTCRNCTALLSSCCRSSAIFTRSPKWWSTTSNTSSSGSASSNVINTSPADGASPDAT
mmetsp:Transcript_38529/g.114329  ORF Transcript_38529/g.114329 Transcript_38529/m.114329 type:complete len:206 (-) Transcript_38529:3160-3777(-)